jgi:hypothetical protein
MRPDPDPAFTGPRGSGSSDPGKTFTSQKVEFQIIKKFINQCGSIRIRIPNSGTGSVADQDPGSRGQKGTGSRIRNTAGTTVGGSGMGRKSASGSGMNNPDHIF